MGERPITERRPFAVGSTTATLVDTTRPTPGVPGQGIAAVPRRTVDLIVLYPTDEGTPPTDPTGLDDGREPPADSGAAPVGGPLPLLVFGHGWNGSGASLLAPASRWASAGYVVALPTFPLSREGIAVSDDLVHQPGDVSFVIDTLLARSADPDDLLADRIDPDRIAVGGHSLGSATAFGFENSCCRDDRVRAIVAISGGPAPYATGGYDATFTTPLLLVHGVADPGVNSAISEAVFAQTPGPMSLLLLDDADHTSLFGGEDGAVLDRVVVAWLDRQLGIDPAATDGLEEEVTATGRGSLRSKTT
jgi:predicted dienelactone hydrolase